jgi:hypothetical protein
MYVYGIHCAPADLQTIPLIAEADYFMDYGLLVFPQYSKPVFLTTRGRTPSANFWADVAIVAKRKIVPVSREDPYITDEEEEMVKAIQEIHPYSDLQWFYVP